MGLVPARSSAVTKIVLAFVLIWQNGTFHTGTVVNKEDWDTVAHCREDMQGIQNKMTSNGLITTIGCFEVTIPNEKGPE